MEKALVLKAPNNAILAQGRMPKGKLKTFAMNCFFRAITRKSQERTDIPNIVVKKTENKIAVNFIPVPQKSDDEAIDGVQVMKKEDAVANLLSRMRLSQVLPASAGGVLSLPVVYQVVINGYEAAMAAAGQAHNAMVSLGLGVGIFAAGVALGLLYRVPAWIGYKIFKNAVGMKDVQPAPAPENQ